MLSVDVGSVYVRHDGDRTMVLHLAVHSETYERLVVHRAFENPDVIWATPISEFLKQIEIKGIYVPQFKKEPIEENSQEP